jgi:ABC-2 type transport system ATP-binding protein
MRRRLELACGLINRPHLFFLDEPTLGLDVQTRAATWNYIKLLKKEYGMTVFMTTHYLEEADMLCDRIAIIDYGKIIAVGKPNDLKEGLGGDIMTLSIQDSKADISDLIQKIPKVKEVKKQDSTYRIKVVDGEETAPIIIDAVRAEGHKVTRLALTKPTLDEVYLEYTGRTIREEEESRESFRAQRIAMRRSRGESARGGH